MARDKTSEDKASRTPSEKALVALAGVMAAGLIGIALFAATSLLSPATPDPAEFASNLSFMFFIAASTALAGALTGFIFGIPRALQQGSSDQVAQPVPAATTSSPPTPRASSERHTPAVSYSANTNLEQISDWLTKILVGVGLTQLIVLPENLWGLAGSLSAGMTEVANAQAVVATTVVFYIICGFLFSYLWTRLFLAGAFREADLQALERKVEETLSEIEKQGKCDAAALSLAQQCLNPRADGRAISAEEMNRAIAEASPAARTTIFYQAWDARSKNWKDDKEKMARTIPLFEALIAADHANEYHKNHAQLGFALKDKAKPEWQRAYDELSRAIEIRGDWEGHGWILYEWNRSVCAIQMELNGLVSEEGKGAWREQVIADLTVAHHSPELLEWSKKEQAIRAWLKHNQLNLERVQPKR